MENRASASDARPCFIAEIGPGPRPSAIVAL